MSKTTPLLLCLLSLLSCSPDLGKDLDPPDRVAFDYLERWIRQDGSHSDLEFASVPDAFPAVYRTKLEPFSGADPSVQSVRVMSSAISGPGKRTDLGPYMLEGEGIPLGGGRSMSFGKLVAYWVRLEIRFEDETSYTGTIYLRPDVEFTGNAPLTGPITWKVIP